jgi:predicted small integral membrane protein
MFDWMAWTWQSAVFFGFVIFMLVVLTLLAIFKPETPRVGILRFPTTRGDRFFVTMVGGCVSAAAPFGIRSAHRCSTGSRCSSSRNP